MNIMRYLKPYEKALASGTKRKRKLKFNYFKKRIDLYEANFRNEKSVELIANY